MATPVGIVLRNYDVIIEPYAGVNTFQNPKFGGGYARQIGTLVTVCDVDDYVQYANEDTIPFKQSGVTYVWAVQDDILFVQEEIP